MSRLTKEIIDSLPPREVLIETGTGSGDTLAAMEPLFRQCYSVEVYRPYYLAAMERFAGSGTVGLIYGSSRDALHRLIDPNHATLFWLDAHFTGGHAMEHDGRGQCPLREELREITSHRWRVRPVILIDDSFMFTGRLWTHHGDAHKFRRDDWPTLAEIESTLFGYRVTERGDVLHCVPEGEP